MCIYFTVHLLLSEMLLHSPLVLLPAPSVSFTVSVSRSPHCFPCCRAPCRRAASVLPYTGHRSGSIWNMETTFSVSNGEKLAQRVSYPGRGEKNRKLFHSGLGGMWEQVVVPGVRSQGHGRGCPAQAGTTGMVVCGSWSHRSHSYC